MIKKAVNKATIDKKSGNKKTVEDLQKRINDVTGLIDKYTQERLELSIEKFYLECVPYKEGDKVKAMFNDKEVIGVLELDTSTKVRFHFFPVKTDGTLSSKYRIITAPSQQIVGFAE